jgi:DNA polymerase I-like protein with 3'-5' exonuclease and polymerase domains
VSVLTFDLETGTATKFKRKASSFAASNYIVAAGFKRDDGPVTGTYYTSKEASTRDYFLPLTTSDELLVGFNIKFDLLYSWHRPELQDFFRAGGKIWDCQYAEYLLEGHRQHAQMASMDSVIEKYGGTLKIDEVKELWNAGIDTPDIDETLLMDYLLGTPDGEVQGDVNNTYLIYLAQRERAEKLHPNFMAMLERRMDGLLATTEMEYNGLKLDTVRGEADRVALVGRLRTLAGQLEEYIPRLPPELEFNWQSIYHKSALIYGGTIRYERWVQHVDEEDAPLYSKSTEKWPLFDGVPVCPTDPSIQLGDSGLYERPTSLERQDTFASGKRQGEGKTKNVSVDDLTRPKGAKQDFLYEFKGYTKAPREWVSTCKDGAGDPIYSTSSGNLEILTGLNKDVPFLKVLGERNKVSKDLGTYYWAEDKKGDRKGMLTLVDDEGFIHHKLNHTSTITSRLSSSDPNMQNIPRGDKSDAKAMFVSRFGDDGVMAELDYSQLEVVIQGILTNDKQLIADLLAGVDFHCKRLAAKLNEPYDEVVAKAKDDTHPDFPRYSQMRTEIKGFTFQRAYGAGPTAIAASTGMTVEEVEDLIRVEERLYPGLNVFDGIVSDSINATRKTTNKELFVAGQRFNAAIGEWFSPTGTRYVWTEGEVPKFLHKKGKFVGFSPTERKNWPIQGLGGEVMQAMLGYVFRKFLQEDNFGGRAFLVNTVHDCIWLDLHKDVADEVIPVVKTILEAVPTMFKRCYNMKIPVKFPVDAEVGPNMLDLSHFEG